jgi:hypothetical protein
MKDQDTAQVPSQERIFESGLPAMHSTHNDPEHTNVRPWIVELDIM